MSRTDGLVRLADKSKKERVEIASSGGRRSAEVRKENAMAKRAALLALKLKPNIDPKQKAALKQMGVDTTNPLTIMTISMTRVAYKAMNGDIKALRFLMEAAHLTPNVIMEQQKIELAREQLAIKQPITEFDDAEIVVDNDTSKIEEELRKMGVYKNG